MLTEEQAWLYVKNTIHWEVKYEGRMEYGGLCGYIDHLGQRRRITTNMVARMKSRLLTSRYTEGMLCYGYRWKEYNHKPRLAFIRNLLRTEF